MKNTYSEMKDSGVAWIGKIPNHWQAHKAKVYIKITNGSDPETEGDIPVYGSGANCFKTCGEYKEGPAVLVGRKGSIDRPRYLEGRYWNVDTAFDVKTICNFSLRLYYYLALCFDYQYYVSQTTLPSMTQTNYRNMFIPIPSLTEQTAIAAYLDEKCGTIDEIIAEAKASIEEYKAWKSSVIFEAVTKGLDPHAEMKDSGVEWIGKVPKHWKVCTLKRLCSQITDGSHFSPETVDDGFPYITAGDVSGKGLNYAATKKISTEDFENLQRAGCRPYKGDVLLVKDGATTGRTGLMIDDTPCVALSSVAILRPAATVNSAFLMYMMMSELLQFQIRMSMAGSAMPRTTLSKLVEYKALFCENEEQLDIVKYLDEKCATIDGIIAEKEALIADMEAYKKSLIFETVTGKRKVC